MAQRFYQVKFENRPAFFGDLGNNLKITGVMFEGQGTYVMVLTPASDFAQYQEQYNILSLNDAEWSEVIQASDDPKIFELDPTGGIKAVHRKVRYQISGAVQQKIWVRDGLKCMFCNQKIGEVQLTIDHFIPLELGGANDPSNYLSACRKCNKRKGSMEPREYCKRYKLDFDFYEKYLKEAVY